MWDDLYLSKLPSNVKYLLQVAICYLFLKAQHVNLIPVVVIPQSMNLGDK